MATTARLRRLAADWEQVHKDFAGHKNIIVTPEGGDPPEKYHVTYLVNGIYLAPNGAVQTLNRHEVEIILHSDYPRYKPLCKLLTPIWHPNFRDGQICIGDIWGAGESLSDIIINIGDMIQYKSWNSYSPLSADAAKWAIENRGMFPVGNINLHVADYASAKDTVEIDFFDDEPEPTNQSADAVESAPDVADIKEISKDEKGNINEEIFVDVDLSAGEKITQNGPSIEDVLKTLSENEKAFFNGSDKLKDAEVVVNSLRRILGKEIPSSTAIEVYLDAVSLLQEAEETDEIAAKLQKKFAPAVDDAHVFQLMFFAEKHYVKKAKENSEKELEKKTENVRVVEPKTIQEPIEQSKKDATPDSISTQRKPSPNSVQSAAQMPIASAPTIVTPVSSSVAANDFEIDASELVGISYTPMAQRMQSQVAAPTKSTNRKAANLKTIFVKGLLFAIIGALVGYFISEATWNGTFSYANIASALGEEKLATYYQYSEEKNEAKSLAMQFFAEQCDMYGYDKTSDSDFAAWCARTDLDSKAKAAVKDYKSAIMRVGTAEDAAEKAFKGTKTQYQVKRATILCIHTVIWYGIIAISIGLFIGLGEGFYYGSVGQAVKYAFRGAAIALVLGMLSGAIGQITYDNLYSYEMSDALKALLRGFSWALSGLGIGCAAGCLKPTKKRVKNCVLGGLVGGFIGGSLFNYFVDVFVNDSAARCGGILITGVLIGFFIGFGEQLAKEAWLKVIRGEFEGKEYMLFGSHTSIGNNNKNTIVLFKDKLVAPHHCDIDIDGNRYVIIDQGSPMGTIVNGVRVTRQQLRQGDAIALGNSVLIFNTK